MAQVIYTAQAVADLERVTDFLMQDVPADALQTVDLIAEAVQILHHHPLVGRPVENALRELVISRGRSGYLALYRIEEARDVVLVLAIRHQREAGYADAH